MMDLSEGKMYHAIMYGLNMMGSHASQVSHEDRWMIIKYIKSLQAATLSSEVGEAGDVAGDEAAASGTDDASGEVEGTDTE